MILSDEFIEFMISHKNLCGSSIDCNSIQPASLDITLGDTWAEISANNTTHPWHIIQADKSCYSGLVLDPTKPIEYTTTTADSYIIYPKSFILATTQEYINIPEYLTAFVEVRSSIGRMGLFIQNAGWVDPGFSGQITLELFNASDYAIQLTKGMRIGQLVFATMTSPAAHPYDGKYQGQTDATGSKIYKDWQK